jgi:NADH:ubiquinone oxidoreductase subunit F (NADH-binding)
VISEPLPGQLPRLLPAGFAAGPASLADHRARYGTLPLAGRGRAHRAALIEEIHRSGLCGRGGAAFPTARKLAAVAAGHSPVVVANGTEGEPASAKDKVLLARSPHLVLDGAVLAADMVGAGQAVIVVHPSVREIIDDAVAERRAAGSDPVRLRVVTAADRFVAGEASAVVHWIERDVTSSDAVARALLAPDRSARAPADRREPPPHDALIARYGASWFRAAGTPAEPGSMLVTILGAVREPCVHEIEIGTPVNQVLGLAGGASAPLQALLLGGYFGTWVSAAAVAPLPFSAAGLAPLGASTGAGLIAALPDGACGLAETARVVRYLADESAGQCGPCIFGLDAIAGQLQQIADGSSSDLGPLRRWLGQADGRGACSHPDGAVRLVRSTLSAFGPELDEARAGLVPRDSTSRRAARAAVAATVKAYSRLRVDPIACDGRGLCAEILPELITLDDWGYPIISDRELTGVCTRRPGRRSGSAPKLAPAHEGPGRK